MTGSGTLGAMQDWPLRIMRLMDHAEREHGNARNRRRARRRNDHPHRLERGSRMTRGAWPRRWSGSAFDPGDRVATLAMNHDRHLAAWFGVVGMGGVLHTVNPRLFDDQLEYIINHAEDRVLLYDARLRAVGRADEAAAGRRSSITSASTTSSTTGSAPEDGDYRWIEGDERDPCGLCYTSGTTGNPKGVLYEHRSTVLHAMSIIAPDMFDLSARSVMLPVVPMFHANSWCMPYAAAITGLQAGALRRQQARAACAACSTRRG